MPAEPRLTRVVFSIGLDSLELARRALGDAGLKPADIDLLIVATITPDLPMPATACLVQHKLGVPSSAACFDVNAACHALGLPLVSGAVGRWSAQVSVFKSGLTRGKPQAERLPCYRCLVAEMPETEETCAAVGVIGPLTGMIGAALAVTAGVGEMDVLTDAIGAIDGVERTTTSIILSTKFER